MRILRKIKLRLAPALLLAGLACLLSVSTGAAQFLHGLHHHHDEDHSHHAPESCAVCHLIAAGEKAAVPEPATHVETSTSSVLRFADPVRTIPTRLAFGVPSPRGPPV